MKKHIDEKRLELNVKKHLKNTSVVDEALLDVLIEISMLHSTNVDIRTEWIVNCVQSNGAKLATVKLWSSLIRDYPTADQIKKARNAEIKKNNDKLLHKIIYAKASCNKDQCSKLLHDIACYIAIDAGLGDITNTEVLNHIITALKSVLPLKQVARFTCKKLDDKLKQLRDLSNIVTGVKLYNEDCNTGGEVSIKLEKVITKAKNFLSRLSQSSLIAINDATKYVICNFNKTDSKVEDVKSYIIFQHAVQKCITNILNDINFTSDQLHALVAQLRQKIISVRRSIKFRPAVPVAEIYPEFEEISLLWLELQHMIIRINVTCHYISKLSSVYNSIKVDAYLDNIDESNDGDDDDGNIICNDYCQVIHEFINDGNNLQYDGYCLYSFVKYDGLLRKSDPQLIPIVKYDHLHYSFTSKKALSQFSYNPKFFIGNGIKQLRKYPEVIKVLSMENYATVKKSGTIRKGNERMMRMMDKGIQTELHPLEILINENINYKYTNSNDNAWHSLQLQL